MASYERVVLSIDETDLELNLDPEVFKELKQRGLVDACIDRAAKYMSYSVDGADFFGDDIREAADWALSEVS